MPNSNPGQGISGLAALLLVGAALQSACAAVYPELSTPVRLVPPHLTLVPAPPEDLLFIKFAGAIIPERTRDGRAWDAVGGSQPDAFAKLFIDDIEVIVTPVQSNTFKPTWPNQRKGNHYVPRGATVRAELWEANPINNKPICVSTVRDVHAETLTEGITRVDCTSGAEIHLVIDPAHGRLGLGFFYELRREDVFVTRVLRQSPAGRAGLARGDQVLKIQGQDVKTMASGEVQSLINSNAVTGVTLLVRKLDRSEAELQLKEGAIYPAVDEGVPVDG
jgi:hypothetical protein